jgi:hypothetical protein
MFMLKDLQQEKPAFTRILFTIVLLLNIVFSEILHKKVQLPQAAQKISFQSLEMK